MKPQHHQLHYPIRNAVFNAWIINPGFVSRNAAVYILSCVSRERCKFRIVSQEKSRFTLIGRFVWKALICDAVNVRA